VSSTFRSRMTQIAVFLRWSKDMSAERAFASSAQLKGPPSLERLEKLRWYKGAGGTPSAAPDVVGVFPNSPAVRSRPLHRGRVGEAPAGDARDGARRGINRGANPG
jgi:hypothetical protein